eukprot:gene26401-biopygen16283
MISCHEKAESSSIPVANTLL